MLSEPAVALPISQGSISDIVAVAINFHGQPRLSAEEVQNIRTDGMLAAKPQALKLPIAELLPEEDLRQIHVAAQRTRSVAYQ